MTANCVVCFSFDKKKVSEEPWKTRVLWNLSCQKRFSTMRYVPVPPYEKHLSMVKILKESWNSRWKQNNWLDSLVLCRTQTEHKRTADWGAYNESFFVLKLAQCCLCCQIIWEKNSGSGCSCCHSDEFYILFAFWLHFLICFCVSSMRQTNGKSTK